LDEFPVALVFSDSCGIKFQKSRKEVTMKKWIVIRRVKGRHILILLLLTAVLVSIHPLYAWAEKKQLDSNAQYIKGKIIAIDAGHGGVDPGAVGYSGTMEKDINLQLAKKLKTLLEEAGATVIMTRKTDDCYSEVKKEDLDARAKLVSDGDADIFLSLQCNSLKEEKWHGSQVFYYPGSALGEKLATLVQQGLSDELRNSDRKALSHNEIYILRALSIPAVVVEAGFLSNPEEEALLMEDAYQSRVVYGIYCGIIEYYKFLYSLDDENQDPSGTQ